MQSKTEAVTQPTVLVVDDNSGVRAVERRVLENAGYRVLEATNGAEGIDCLAGNAPIDLLIADLEMPVLAGAEMVRRIRMLRPDLRVLYVTGQINSLMDGRALWEGEAFLEKPFTVAGLQEAVSLLLKGTLARTEVQTRSSRV